MSCNAASEAAVRGTSEELAAFWFAGHLRGLSEAEVAQFSLWIDAEQGNADAYERVAASWSSITHFAEDPEVRAMRDVASAF